MKLIAMVTLCAACLVVPGAPEAAEPEVGSLSEYYTAEVKLTDRSTGAPISVTSIAFDRKGASFASRRRISYLDGIVESSSGCTARTEELLVGLTASFSVSAAGVAFTVNDSALVAMGTGASDCGTIQVPEVRTWSASSVLDVTTGREAGYHGSFGQDRDLAIRVQRH